MNNRQIQEIFNNETDIYAILQLNCDLPEPNAFEAFVSLKRLRRQGKEPNIDHYEMVYTAPLPAYEDLNDMLEELYVRFNIDRPEDFKGHSLSVSDIIVIRQNGQESAYYVDDIGFKELNPGFLEGSPIGDKHENNS